MILRWNSCFLSKSVDEICASFLWSFDEISILIAILWRIFLQPIEESDFFTETSVKICNCFARPIRKSFDIFSCPFNNITYSFLLSFDKSGNIFFLNHSSKFEIIFAQSLDEHFLYSFIKMYDIFLRSFEEIYSFFSDRFLKWFLKIS